MPASTLTFSELQARFAFEDDDECSGRIAFQLRIGPEQTHRDLTFGELATAARLNAGALTGLGCVPGQRVALLLPHSERLVIAFFGALYAGLVPSIVAWPTSKMDPVKYRRNLLAVVEGLAADWIVTDAGMVEQLGSAIGTARVLAPHALSSSAPSAPAVRCAGTAFIQFSGGTTGTQKSVPVSLRHLHRQLERYATALELSSSDRLVSWLPLYHDMGLVACLLLPFVFRLPVVMFSPIEWVMDPAPFLRVIGREKCSLCWLPNFAFSFLATRARAAPGSYDLSSLRAVINCSEPIRAASMDAFLNRFRSDGLDGSALASCYAMAEATFAVTQSAPGRAPRRIRVSTSTLAHGEIEIDPASDRELVSCGAPLAGTEIRIATTGTDVARGHAIGEIQIRSESMMDGYLESPGKPVSSQAFEAGWYCSGDLGAIVDGELYVTGRKKDLVIVGGVNVYPEDIEAAVSELAGVHAGRVVAMGVTDPELGTERLVVVAEASDDAALQNTQTLEADIRKTAIMVAGIAPFRVFVVEPRWIVKSTAGKISRSETRSRVLERYLEKKS